MYYWIGDEYEWIYSDKFVTFQNSVGSFDDDDHFFLKCYANVYLSCRCVAIVYVALEQQYEQFTWVKTDVGIS